MNPFRLTMQNKTSDSADRLKHLARTAIILCCTVGIVAVTGPSVWAQSDTSSQTSLVREIERLRNDLSDIQRYVYRGEATTVPKASSGSAPASPDTNGRLQRQIIEIQGQLRELTGHIERVQHDIRQMGDRLNKLVADVDIRLQALESGTPLASNQQRPPAVSQPVSPQPNQPVGTTVISSGGVTGGGLAPGQKELGQITQSDLAALETKRPLTPAPVQQAAPAVRPTAPPPPKAQAAPVSGGVTTSVASVARPLSTGELPEGSVQQQYDYAFGKLKTRNYDDAENALRAFVDRHPDAPLAGNAMYWMGETYYVRKQYAEAARIFLDAYQRFPKGNKAPDNLFKLAKSLVQIGENQSACTTYAELVKTFPRANQRILSGARTDMTRLGCG